MDYASSPTPFVVHPWEQVQYEIPRPLRQAPPQPTMFSQASNEFAVFEDSVKTDNRTLFAPAQVASQRGCRASAYASIGRTPPGGGHDCITTCTAAGGAVRNRQPCERAAGTARDSQSPPPGEVATGER